MVDDATRAILVALLERATTSKARTGGGAADELDGNIQALQTVLALADGRASPCMDDLQRARGALGLMGGRTDEALRKTRPGTTQASQLRGRLQALRAGLELVGVALRDAEGG